MIDRLASESDDWTPNASKNPGPEGTESMR